MRCWILAEEQLLGFSMHRYRNGEHKYVILLRTRAISLRPKYLMIELTHQNISQINCSDNNKCICWFGGRAVLSHQAFCCHISQCISNRYIGSNLIHTTNVKPEFVCKPGKENSARRLYKLQDRRVS
ncbi:Hypothetical_protein [Hexamita inflata]|uniref:Hypothetical_protein n=1 Tax=Hexamita inflata TaxID=28002 RepID=A0ABP1GGZ2_9EUKA